MAFKKLFILIAIFGSLHYNSAQTTQPELKSYAPVSPNAASLGQYGLYPVNYNLGTVNTGVPLYTINTGKLQLPISLSYNTGGIKVNQLASWVGLGWTLNSGGAIVRNLKGTPDNLGPSTDIIPLNNASFNQANYDYMYGVYYGQLDSRPDEFAINAPGISGTFYFDPENNGEVIFSDHTKAKVSVLNNTNTIEVVRTDGVILRFGVGAGIDSDGTEISRTPQTIDVDPYPYISAWYLTEMISPYGDVISFKYKKFDISWDYPVATSESVVIPSTSPLKGNYPAQQRIDKKYLERIEFNNGYVLFDSNLSRLDLEDEFQLNHIKVYAGTYGVAGEKLIEQYTFDYNYFIRSGGTYPDGYLDIQGPDQFMGTRLTNSRTKSLKLEKVIIGKTTETQEYTFDYSAIALPLRGSTSQDYWGYANNNSGSLLMPTSGVFSPSGSQGPIGPPIVYDVGDGNRDADLTLMEAATLNKITYPTGGHSTFEYGAYSYDESITTPALDHRHASLMAFGTDCDASYGPSTITGTFDVNPLTYVSGSAKINVHFSESVGQGNGFTRVELNGTTYSGPTNGSTSSLAFELNVDLVLGENTIGAFEFRSGSVGNAYGCPITSIYVTWDEDNGSTTTTTNNVVIGGLRVESIKNYDGIDPNPISIKEFEYAGANILQPKLNRSETSLFLNPNRDLQLLVSTNTHYDNNIGSRPVIEYGQVSEVDININDASTNGKTVYYYDIIPSQRLLELGSPVRFAHPQQDLVGSDDGSILQTILNDATNSETFSFFRSDKWQYGSLRKKEIKKNIGTTQNPNYVDVSVVEHNYTPLVTSMIKENFVSMLWINDPLFFPAWTVPDPVNGDYGNSNVFSYFVGEISLGRKSLTQTITTNFDLNGNNPISQTTDFFYDNLDHLQTTRVETVNSKGDLIKSKTSYAQDLINQTLIDQNRISEPLLVESFIKVGLDPEELLSSQSTIYFDSNSNYMPNKIQTAKGSDNLEERIIFNEYDTYGNPIDISKVDGTRISYIWGYNGQYPVAKIENASHADIENLSAFVNDFDLGPDGLSTVQIDALRNNLTNAFVSTYIYDPLVGVISMTDPKGYTMTYEYDEFNRLKTVKDNDGNIINQTQYNYRD